MKPPLCGSDYLYTETREMKPEKHHSQRVTSISICMMFDIDKVFCNAALMFYLLSISPPFLGLYPEFRKCSLPHYNPEFGMGATIGFQLLPPCSHVMAEGPPDSY